MSFIGLFFAILSSIATLRSSTLTFSVLAFAALFQAASAVAIGAANLTPGHMAVFFLALAALIRPDGFRDMLKALWLPSPGFFLLIFTLWAIFGSIIMPRLFADQIEVIPLTAKANAYYARPLVPVAANLNQSFYAAVNLLVFCITIATVRSRRLLVAAALGLLLACVLNVSIAIIDSATYTLGASEALSFMRNADYAQAYSQTIYGMKRLSGSYPEPSVFAATTVGLFAFSFRLWRGGFYPKYSGVAAAGSFFGVIFAFSTTGYVAAFVYLVLVYSSNLFWLDRSVGTSSAAHNRRYFLISLGPIGALAFAIVLAIKPDLLTPAAAIFDNTLVNKASSSSGIERTAWNMGGLRAFMESWGLGVGIGSVRVSSFLVALIATTGLVGFLMFTTFLASIGLHQEKRKESFQDVEQISAAARSGCFALLLAATLSATAPDLGLFFFMFAGLACASKIHEYSTKIPVKVFAGRSENAELF